MAEGIVEVKQAPWVEEEMPVTEADWLACTDPQSMLEFLRGKVSDRKLRLFVCAYCWLLQHALEDWRSRRAVEIAERFADGLVKESSLREAKANAIYVMMESHVRLNPLTGTAASAAWDDPWWAAHRIVAEATGQTDRLLLLRCIFGNPFRPLTLYPTWLTPRANHLAEQVYNDRAFDRLPILGDALEEAGCTNTDILDHCRAGGLHVRGCWVVDTILQKK